MTVYFIQSGDCGPVKIGFTESCINKRLSQLQVSALDKLHLIAAIDGDVLREKELHEKFKPHRIRGEWFHYHNDIALFVEPYRVAKGLAVVRERGQKGPMTPDEFRTIRKDAALTQADLAERLGAAQSSISKFETGAAIIDPKTELAMLAIAAGFTARAAE